MPLFVLAGSAGTGKTSCLRQWMHTINGVGGFVCPVINGVRHFELLTDKLIIDLEAPPGCDEDVLYVGKYKFLKASFENAAKALNADWNSGLRFCLLDEFGPLEFNNTGLMPGCKNILCNSILTENQNLIVVVRNTLLKKICQNYNVKEVLTPTIFKKKF